MNKLLILYFLISLLDCSQSKVRLKESFGCVDFMDPIYLYNNYEKGFSNCKKWKGKTVENDIDLNKLIQTHPDCEALNFEKAKYSDIRTKIKEDISNLRKLRYLEYNAINFDIPTKDIEKLTNLEEFHFNALFLDSIDIDFSKLHNLKRLIIYNGSSLNRFPASISKCYKLEYLVIHNTMSNEETLYGLENLKNLKDLHISYPIYGIPNKKVSFSKIKRMSITQHEDLHESIYALKELEYFELSYPLGSVDFTEISKLETLKFLKLDRLESFSNSLKLPKLTSLTISQFFGNDLVVDLEKLPNLKQLEINNTMFLKSLAIKNINKLEKLTINGNNRLNELIVQEDQLKNIKEIDISLNGDLLNKRFGK